MKIQVVIEAESIQEYTSAIQALAAGYSVQAPVINVVAGTEKSAATVDSDEVNDRFQRMPADQMEEGEAIPPQPAYVSTKVAKRLDDKISKLCEEDVLYLFKKFDVSHTGEILTDEVKQFDAEANKLIKAQKEAEAPKEEKSTATPETEEKTSEQATETSEQSEKAPKYGFASVKLMASKLAKIPGGKDDIKFLLEKFGVAKLSELKEDQYDAFHAEVSDAIEAYDNSTPISKGDETDTNETKEEKSESKEVTIEMIRSKAKELSVAGYKEDIKSILKEFKAPSLTKIDKKDYVNFYSYLENING